VKELSFQDLTLLRAFYGPLPEPPRDAFGFYAWYVLGARTTPARRDAAVAALKHIPAFTPDSVWKAPRAKLQAAVALAGPFEERMRALLAGAEVFRYHRDLEDRVRGSLRDARRAVRRLEPLDRAGAHWMLLAVGDHPIVPRHPGVARVLERLDVVPAASDTRAERLAARALSPLAAVPSALKPTFPYLVHHATVTCTSSDPHCRVCPLAAGCPQGGRWGR
jgi:endonuclease III